MGKIPAKIEITNKADAGKALEKATKDWRAAKKRERAARDVAVIEGQVDLTPVAVAEMRLEGFLARRS